MLCHMGHRKGWPIRAAGLAFFLLSLAGACAPDKDPAPGCDAAADADGDGLDDCAEADLGTDADSADSDGDGLTDGEEAECVSDPLDEAERCYACGWAHNDPGDLEATGSGEGDTVENLALIDQCGEAVALWDMAEEYHIAFMTAEW